VWAVVLALVGWFVSANAQAAGCADPAVPRGEFGGDLTLLSRFCTGPQGPHESNYYIDMWAGRNMEQIMRLNGLTNNQALFINSHGKGGQGPLGNRFGFYPHAEVLKGNGESPVYSVRDLATVLGPEKAAAIRTIYLSACDIESCFSAGEIKRFFVNVTAVAHTPKGESGYQPMFYDAIVNPSWEIQPLYEIRVPASSGKSAFEIGLQRKAGARKLNVYVAELFLPTGKEPCEQRVAGRELLERGRDPELLQPISARQTAEKLQAAASRR
jgi:hypothetical protein